MISNKQLAEMVKRFRAKKLEEIIGKPKKFEPVHIDTQDKSSPNEYLHRMKEERLDELGPTHAAGLNKQSGIISKMPSDRKRYQGGNQKRSISTYTSEENKKELDLGKTDTNQAGETVSMNPNIPSAKGETTKNTTIKERKEK